MTSADFLWANRFALELVRAIAKPFLVHLANHAKDALILLRLALREMVEVRGFC